MFKEKRTFVSTCPASSILHKNRKRYQTTVAVTLTIDTLNTHIHDAYIPDLVPVMQ
jgi:hypothetical protein